MIGFSLVRTLVIASSLVAHQAQAPSRQFGPERDVFENMKAGVFRVDAGLRRGSGFLAQLPGVSEALIITNDHVVAGDTSASVYLDSVTRVPVAVVARDRDADIAVLRLPPGSCSTCPRLPLAPIIADEPSVVTGERVLAIGFPLNQGMTLTTGIVSNVRAGAIISDINLNHGNSGGPMLNLAGEVVGINTFVDFTTDGGPGVSGTVPISKLRAILDVLPQRLATAPTPRNVTLPVLPQDEYKVAWIRAAADSIDPGSYLPLFHRSLARFDVNIVTPVVSVVSLRALESEIARDRWRREKKAGVSTDDSYSVLGARRDWQQYVGGYTTPVVTISVVPKVGETTPSLMGRAIVAGVQAAAGAPVTPIQASYVFQGDVRGVRFYRHGNEILPISGGHGPQAVWFENMLIKLKDVADMGYYVLPPEVFEPDSDGAPAIVLVAIQDLKNPSTAATIEIDGITSARIWNDFRPFFAGAKPQRRWIAANPLLVAPATPMKCDGATGSCIVAR